MERDKLIVKARRRVDEFRCFYIHLMVYILVNLGLMLLNVFTFPKSWWFFYPFGGWGIGVVMHFISVFLLGRDWEDRKVEKILEKMEERQRD